MTNKKDHGSLYRMLDLGILFLFGFIITLRLFNAGQDINSLYTAFAESCIWLVAVLFMIRRLAAEEFTFRLPSGFMFAGLFVLSILVSVYTAASQADGFHAALIARHWIFEIVFYLLVFNFCISKERCNALVALFTATLVMICVFGLYQCFYAIDYFINLVKFSPGLVENMVGDNSVHKSLFMARIRSVRIYGPYAYPNTLAGMLLLILPFLCFYSFRKVEKQSRLETFFKYVLLSLAFSILLLTGSKAGIFSALLGQVLIFAWLKLFYGKFGNRSYLEIFSLFVLNSCAVLLVAVILKVLLNSEGFPARVPVLIFCGILWALSLKYILFACTRDWSSATKRVVSVAGSAIILAAVCAVLFIASGRKAGNFENLNEKSAALRERAAVQLSVRYNYWLAAIAMIKKYPVLGTGLDQYGNFYTQFKTISGWAVKRAHNTYLQILTDGGLLLFLSFLFFWGFFFKLKNSKVLPDECSVTEISDNRESRRLVYPVFFALPTALLLTCFVFSGLCIDYFFNEINGGHFSSWPADKLPAFIHLLIHICIMPVCGTLAFFSIWKFLNQLKGNEAWLFFKSGMAIIFIHFFFDFHYHMQVVSMSLWFLAALITASFGGIKEFRFKLQRKYADILIVLTIIVFGAIGYKVVFPNWERVNLINTADTLSRAGQYEKSLEIYNKALALEPADSELHRRVASIYSAAINNKARTLVSKSLSSENSSRYKEMAIQKIKPELREQVIIHAKLAVKYNPALAPNYAYLGRELFNMFPCNKEKLQEAEKAFIVAVKNHPYKPSYLVWLANVYTKLGKKQKAINTFKKAYELSRNPLLTDDRAKLNGFEKLLVERVVEEAAGTAGDSVGSFDR